MSKCKIVFEIIINFLGIICFLNIILMFKFNVWTSKALKILFYICAIILIILYIYVILFELSFYFNRLHKLRNLIYKLLSIAIFGCLFLLFSFFEFIIFELNLGYYKKYLKNCPFSISDLDYSLHLERRCELYNINNMNRYSYQYICSYNSSDEFKYKNEKNNKRFKNRFKTLQKEVKPEYVICIQVKNLIPNNEIINLFHKEYSNSDNYYCSRTDKPEDNNFINHKDCNNKSKKALMFYLFSSLSYFQIIYLDLFIGFIIIRRKLMTVNNDYFENINIGIFNNANISRCETKESERSNNNNSIDLEQKTQNIIIENKEVFPIETNINECFSNNKNKIPNSISIESSNFFNENTEKTQINNYLGNSINSINNK